MKEIQFDTKVGKKDLYHFLMRHFYTSFSGIFGIILSLGAFVFFLFNIGKREPYQLLILLVMSSLFTIVQPLQMLQKASMQIKRNPVFQESLHYQINEKGIRVSQNGESTTIEWDHLRKVVETGESFLVYMTVVNANVIPKRQMDGQEEAFREIVKEKMEKGRYQFHERKSK
ncbi:MAG: hypothetical protein PWP24_1658 [Clostridiales bacterium]|nr:hypothetical protein [Clostridiales bacterium]